MSAVQVKTIVVNGRDWDEIDREESRLLSALIGGGDELIQVETVQSRETDINAQSGHSVTIRAYLRSDS